jgi:hypothetical protein
MKSATPNCNGRDMANISAAQQACQMTALQTHRMQLLLLEQANKRRLIMARREQSERDRALREAPRFRTAGPWTKPRL